MSDLCLLRVFSSQHTVFHPWGGSPEAHKHLGSVFEILVGPLTVTGSSLEMTIQTQYTAISESSFQLSRTTPRNLETKVWPHVFRFLFFVVCFIFRKRHAAISVGSYKALCKSKEFEISSINRR